MLGSLVENNTKSSVAPVHLEHMRQHVLTNLRATIRKFHTSDEIPKEQAKLYLAGGRDSAAKSESITYAASIPDLCGKFGFAEYGLLLPFTEHRESDTAPDLFSMISGIRLIDADQATWDQIIDLRERTREQL